MVALCYEATFFALVVVKELNYMFVGIQCTQIIIKGAVKVTKVNYLEGTYLDYQLNDESVLIET